MATVGTLVRNPGIVPLTVTAASPAIIRGQAVVWDTGNSYARPATTGDLHIFGIAVSDSDTDLLQVWVASRCWTISVAIKTGDVPAMGAPLYVDAVSGKFTVTAGGAAPFNVIAGYVTSAQVDQLGNIEMAIPLIATGG
jgi:hypothetical protein